MSVMLSRPTAECNWRTTEWASPAYRAARFATGRAAFNARATISKILRGCACSAPSIITTMNGTQSAFEFDRCEPRKDYFEMSHYRCDMCKGELDPTHDVTYVVRMEVYPAPTETDAAIDSDRDYLDEIQEVLERLDEFEADGLLPEGDTFRQRRFKLCQTCCERFAQEPLGRRLTPQFDFSKR
jgi:hypothetical protein